MIEKDIWVSYVLSLLFSMPDHKAMAFKGGTSLSKVFGAINRFSEDIDVTVDYRELGCTLSVQELAVASRGVRDRATAALHEELRVYSHEVIVPYLKAQLTQVKYGRGLDLEVTENGEEIRITYPTRVSGTRSNGYLREYVKIEFGGRNIINPNAVHRVVPDIAGDFPSVRFPSAMVTVLAGERTFWEKATLLHALCHKGIREDRNRDSRHWYDLSLLATHECGLRAIPDRDLLADVVQLKKVFYQQGSARYDDCLNGQLVLVPAGENLERLERDFNMMLGSGMLYGHNLSLDQILDELSALQAEINEAT